MAQRTPQLSPGDTGVAFFDRVAVCCHGRMTNRWGPWKLSADCRYLVYREGDRLGRSLDLYRCTTAAEVLDTICHEANGQLANTDDALPRRSGPRA